MSKLLLVDDDTQLLELFKLILENAGHEVQVAETCSDAVLLFAENNPDVVIADLHVPQTEDGVALIRMLKNYKRPRGYRPLRVIVTTGWTEDLPASVEKEAVDRVLAKPVRTDVLLRSIAELAQ